MTQLSVSHLNKKAAKGICLEFILHETVRAWRRIESLTHATDSEAIAILENLIQSDPLVRTSTLDKLFYYCDELRKATKVGENLLPILDNLQTSIGLARATWKRARFAAQSSREALQKWIKNTLTVFFSILSQHYLNDQPSETVLFTMLELKEPINRLLGEATVENLFHPFFPEGANQLSKAITAGFSRRGFKEFCVYRE